MSDAITAKAFGKINLTLEITGKRDDGYHTLRSVMQSVSVYNEVKVFKTVGGGVNLICDDPALPLNSRNTAFYAAQLFLCYAGLPRRSGIFVKLQKRIPYKAGLGSASADAAAVLFACNALFDRPFDDARLLEIAAKIGSDVPFCLTGGTQLATGMGDVLTPLPECPDCALLILFCGEGVSTPEAYKRYDLLKKPVQPDFSLMEKALHNGSLHEVAAACQNVFGQCCPVAAVKKMKRALLDNGALGSAMSGSGTAVFGIFQDAAAAEAARLALQPFGWQSFPAEPVSRGVALK